MSEKKVSEDRLNTVDPSFRDPGRPPLNYNIHGRPVFASVTVYLGENEKVIGDGGALLWMDGDVATDAFCPGGCCSACSRKCSGESCFMNRYTGPGYATFSFDTPGDILPFAVTPNHGWILTKKAFIAGTENCDIRSRFAGCCTAGFAGESLFFTKVTTKEPMGMFFAGGFGMIIRHNVPKGKTLYVDNGLFFAAHEKTNIRMQLLGGLSCTSCCGGEGLVMAFTGPCVVYTQSHDPALWEAAEDASKMQAAATASQGAEGPPEMPE